MAPRLAGCPLCEGEGGRLVLSSARFRIVHADEPGFPGFYRLVWSAHVAEFSQLPRQDRIACTDALALAEDTLRAHLQPDKVNLAALGNMVAHLHWHLIARYTWDTHFPAAVWATAARAPAPERLAAVAAKLPALEDALRERFAGFS